MRILFALAALVTSQAGLACSCRETPDELAFEEASTVFRALVTHAEEEPEMGGVRAAFRVVEVFKGDARRIKALRSPGLSDSCGVRLVPGAEYLVFAGAGDSVTIAACGHSRSFSEAAESEWLRKHRPPRPTPGTAL